VPSSATEARILPEVVLRLMAMGISVLSRGPP
jgi:hypothetical protein